MVLVEEKEYMLDFFKEKGFIRKKGKRCGEYFWTLNPEFEEPQDTPCVDYWFDKIPSRDPLTLGEAREEFLSFFEEHGHTRIKPRPVVARWREDLYLTIASIVVFQPHVTSGLVPPPANPLTISQPSIRLEDIDNVGLTIGRHLTSFEMAAHHAFNYPDRKVYWKEETVRYAYEFFTERLGIPGEYIVFKESWWEGGGNAGPSFEVTVGGLELATLVFMKYKVEDGRYEEIPLKIVDTGYGVERMAWFTQKTPTAFHAIYGSLLDKYREALGVEEPGKELLWAAFRAAGNLDPEDLASVEAYYKRVSSLSGIPLEEARSMLEREARLYSIIDHAKTIALMLGDGIVPSNTGEGYLARLVIRRALRQARLLGVDASLAELIDWQIDYWRRDYPQLQENRDYIIDAVEWEEKRYRETLARGEALVRKLLRKKKNLTVDDLVKLYDSHGIPPEIVASVAKKMGATVEIPHNFYSIVASRHKAPRKVRRVGESANIPENIAKWALQYPPTRKLYYEDQYMREFTARVLGVKGEYLILDRTAFYPTGGGQLHDTGIIEWEGGKARVIRVEKVNDRVIHIIRTEGDSRPTPCSMVRGVINWARRYRLMRHHTSTHIILGAARRVLGNHVWQAGAEKTPEKARLDITHHKPLTRDEIRRIEELANNIVDDRRELGFMVLPRNEAEEKYGFRIYQGGVPMTPTIRLVEIPEWDVEACGGTHLEHTGEAGAIKIIGAYRIQDGIVRLEYVAGTRVYEEATRLEDKILSMSETLNADPSNLEARAKTLVEEFVKLQAKYKKLLEEKIESLIRELENTKIVVAEAPDTDKKTIQEVMRKLTSRVADGIVVFYYSVNGYVQVEMAAGSQMGVDLGKLAREIAGRLGGRGGGGKTRASLRIPREKLDELITMIKNALTIH